MPRSFAHRHTLLGIVVSLGMAVSAIVVLTPVASAQTVADVTARDQLIANQEALLNVYRCRFDIDTEIVPGGCADGGLAQPAAEPSPFTGTPTNADIEARDNLVQAQEALLNTYRCRFDIDTEIVPGGCIDGAAAPVEETEKEGTEGEGTEGEGTEGEGTDDSEPVLGPPPAELGFDPFYQKYLDANGLPIVTSAAVPDRALYQTRNIIFEMLANRPDILEALAESGMHVTMMAEGTVITQIPEFSQLNEQFPDRDWNVSTRGGGLGLTTFIPVMTSAVENVICLEGDLLPYEDTLIHEMGHAVLNMAIEFQMGDTEFRSRIIAAYESALAAGLWKNTYAATDENEYWAEGTLAWFNLNSPPDQTHNNINTRAELVEYDPALAELLEGVYGDITVSSSCHETRDISASEAEGVVLGPDGQPVEGFLVWLWDGPRSRGSWDISDSDGLFFVRVPSGTYEVHLYSDNSHDCSFVGWYGQGGFTTRNNKIIRFKIDNKDIDGIEVKLPDHPENLPFVAWCDT